jgi:hypothetical protein
LKNFLTHLAKSFLQPKTEKINQNNSLRFRVLTQIHGTTSTVECHASIVQPPPRYSTLPSKQGQSIHQTVSKSEKLETTLICSQLTEKTSQSF